jgi:hypothetical protein
MKRLTIYISLLLCLNSIANAQIHINKEWQTSTGNPIGLEWSCSFTNSNNQLVTIGNS